MWHGLGVHPVERLRAVARARDADQSLLVQEAAVALADLVVSGDERSLVLSARRLLEHHCHAGAMWTLCSRVLQAGDPARDAWRVIEEIDEDHTSTHARACVAAGEVDRVIEAAAGGLDGFLVSKEEARALGEASGPGSRLAILLPWGRALPEAYWQVVRSVAEGDGHTWTVVSGHGVSFVVGPRGTSTPTTFKGSAVGARVDCSVVPDLLIPVPGSGLRPRLPADPSAGAYR